jgi:ribose 5-phosphate isomerase B
MRVALGSDMGGELLESIERWLTESGHEMRRFGALAPPQDDSWPSVGRSVGIAVAGGDVQSGILCCWTGTGVCIAANKVRGVRAALCADAPTATGAREYNDANVLCLSIRKTTPAIVREILQAWFAGSPTSDPAYANMIASIRSL